MIKAHVSFNWPGDALHGQWTVEYTRTLLRPIKAACSAVVRAYAYSGHYGYRCSAIEYTSKAKILASCILMKLGLYFYCTVLTAAFCTEYRNGMEWNGTDVRERTQACKPIHGRYRLNGQNIGHLNLGLL